MSVAEIDDGQWSPADGRIGDRRDRAECRCSHVDRGGCRCEDYTDEPGNDGGIVNRSNRHA